MVQQQVSVTEERCGWGSRTRLWRRNVLILVGSKRKSWISLETLSHPLSTSFLHPLISLHDLLGFVYVLSDKTQTRNGNGSEHGWVCRAVLEAAGCDSSTCIWHFAIYRLFILCSVWIPRGWFILTREPMASLMPSIYSAKRERQEERSISFCVSWSIPSSFPLPAPSCIVETETFLWETCLWHNSMVFDPTSSAIFSPPSLLTIHKLMRLPVQLKPREEEKTGYKALITPLGSFANREWGSATNSNFSVSDKQ